MIRKNKNTKFLPFLPFLFLTFFMFSFAGGVFAQADDFLSSPSSDASSFIPRGATTREQALEAERNLSGNANLDSNIAPGARTQGYGNQAGESSAPLTRISAVVRRLQLIINLLIPFLVGLAVLAIIWGLVGYIINAANEERRKEARQFITWGILGVFIMLSIWGLVNILVNSLPLDNRFEYTFPMGTPTGSAGAPKTIPELLGKLNAVLSGVTPFVFALATFMILVGVVNYVRQAGNEEKVKEARGFIVWGIVFLFVMLSVWGIVNVLTGSFKFENTLKKEQLPELPYVPTN